MTDLVRLRFSSCVLDIQEFVDVWVGVEVMASGGPLMLEAEALDEPYEVVESNVCKLVLEKPAEKPLPIHDS